MTYLNHKVYVWWRFIIRHQSCFHTSNLPTETNILYAFWLLQSLSYEACCRLCTVSLLLYAFQYLTYSKLQWLLPFSAFEREVFLEEMTTTFRGTVMDLPFHWVLLSHDSRNHNASLVRQRPILSERPREVYYGSCKNAHFHASLILLN
jgi:hypothetical protein